MKIVSVAQMQAVEHQSNELGWTYEMMMEKAGSGLAEIIQSFFGYEETQAVLGLVGSGNNGGDTLIALERLAQGGWKTSACLVRPRPDNDPLIRRARDAGCQVRAVEDDLTWLGEQLDDCVVVLDGVLGTGVRLPLKAEIARVLAFVKENAGKVNVIAVDCPSGADCDSGEAAPETIPADFTVCMAAVKRGLLHFPAFELCGSLEVVDIGLPQGLEAWESISAELVDEGMLIQIMPPQRSPNSHKGTYGTVGVVAGSLNFSGAALLSASAAYRIGAGLVQIAAPAPLHTALAGQLPEATWILLPHESGGIAERAVEELGKYLPKLDILLFGPGFGLEETTAAFVRRLLERDFSRKKAGVGFISSQDSGQTLAAELPPMVIDADGLKLLARVPGWPEKITVQAVLTPHPGEMAILTGKPVAEIQSSRLEWAGYYAREWGHVVVLKGALTVIAAPDGRLRVIPVATSALAHGGTGDVLAGMIAGLRSQGLAPFEAATAAAWIHAQTGLLAAEQVGHEASVLAGDLIDVLPEVLAWVW
jgi:ADP-dependent NAD(P)H-hydrate dehydratase / NAD(P)H-hydrate epimerase